MKSENDKDSKPKSEKLELAQDMLMKELVTKEMKEKLSKQIDSENPKIIDAIKSLLHDSND